MRLFIGSASRRRICSVSARSLSFLRAASVALRFRSLLFKGTLQEFADRQVLATAGGALAFDYILQDCDPQFVATKVQDNCKVGK